MDVGPTDATDATDVDDRLKLRGRAADVPTANCRAVSPGASRMALPSSLEPPMGGARAATPPTATATGTDAAVAGVEAGVDEAIGGRDTDAGDVMLRRGRGRDVDDDRLTGRDGGGCAAGSLPGCERLMMRAHVATLMFIWL